MLKDLRLCTSMYTVVDSWFEKGGFMRMCTVATVHTRIDAMKVAAAVLTASNCEVFLLTKNRSGSATGTRTLLCTIICGSLQLAHSLAHSLFLLSNFPIVEEGIN